MFLKILPYQTIFENNLIFFIEIIDWNEQIKLNASLLHKFVQFVPFAGIEIDGEDWDRSWVTGIAIEICLQESGSKFGYRNRDRK